MALYAEIDEISAPAEASAGSLVNVRAFVKNLYSGTLSVMIAGAIDYGVIPWPHINFPTPIYNNLPIGYRVAFDGSFVMPNSAVTINIYSYYYGANNAWNHDGTETKVVNLTGGGGNGGIPDSEVSEFKVSSFSKA